MPTVPIEENRIGIAPVSDAKLRPADMSGTGPEALGTGMRSLAQGIGQLADAAQQHEDIYNEAAVRQADNLLAQQQRGITLDGPDAYYAKTGGDAYGAAQTTLQALAAARNEAAGTLKNDTQRRMFEAVADRRLQPEYDGIAKYAATQLGVYNSDQSKDRLNLASDNAVTFADDPTRFGDEMTRVAAEIGFQTRDMAPGLRDDTLKRAVSGILTRVVDTKMASDVDAAQTFYRAHEDALTPEDRTAIDTAMKEPLLERQAATDVQGLMVGDAPAGGANGAPQDAPRLDLNIVLPKIDAQADWSPERKQAARDQAVRIAAQQDAALVRQHEDAKNAGYQAIDALGPKGFTALSQLPAAVRRTASADTLDSWRAQASQNVRPVDIPENGPQAVYLKLLAARDPDAFNKVDLRDYRPYLAQSELTSLSADQAATRGKPPAEATFANLRTDIDNSIRVNGKPLGLDVTPASNPADLVRYGRVSDLMRSYLYRATDGDKRYPTDKDFTAAFENAVTQVAAQGGGPGATGLSPETEAQISSSNQNWGSGGPAIKSGVTLPANNAPAMSFPDLLAMLSPETLAKIAKSKTMTDDINHFSDKNSKFLSTKNPLTVTIDDIPNATYLNGNITIGRSILTGSSDLLIRALSHELYHAYETTHDMDEKFAKGTMKDPQGYYIDLSAAREAVAYWRQIHVLTEIYGARGFPANAVVNGPVGSAWVKIFEEAQAENRQVTGDNIGNYFKNRAEEIAALNLAPYIGHLKIGDKNDNTYMGMWEEGYKKAIPDINHHIDVDLNGYDRRALNDDFEIARRKRPALTKEQYEASHKLDPLPPYAEWVP